MIVRVWQGKLALWKTFWLFGAGSGILIILPPIVTVLAKIGYLRFFFNGFGFLLLALVFLLLYLVWVFVGIWRAATNYQGNPVWAVLAKLAVAAGTLDASIGRNPGVDESLTAAIG